MFIGDDESAAEYASVLRSFNQKIGELEAQGYTVTGRRRTRATNVAVKGQELSQHLVGTAADFRVPADVPAFVAAARRQGLIALPEIPRAGESGTQYHARTGHWPHIHTQLYAKGRAPLAFFRAAGVLSGD